MVHFPIRKRYFGGRVQKERSGRAKREKKDDCKCSYKMCILLYHSNFSNLANFVKFFYEKTLLLPCAAFFQPVYKNILNPLFFSRGPPRTLLPDMTPRIQFPHGKIDHFMNEKPPTSAFHHELSINHQKSVRDG